MTRRRSNSRSGLWGLAAALALVSPVLAGHLWVASQELPAGALRPANIASVKLEDRRGTLLREVLCREDGRSTWVSLSRISPHVVQATLAGEDRRFYSHGGVDALALARGALLAAARDRVVSGGSTLTMQLARLLDGTPRSLAGKLRQMALAWKLEQALTKQQILWQYLNRAPYGNGTFGVEAAAGRYLGKPAAQLTLGEAALLSALPRSPAGYNPYRHRRRLVRRQRYVLALMEAQGRIDADQRLLAARQPIDLESAARPFSAPHLVQRVLALPEARGAARLRTTLDLPLQRKVEAAVRHVIQRQRQRGITNAAVLVVDNHSSEVLAYVGSADFFDRRRSGQVDGTASLRQPGSAIKPFTYALALEQGKTPASLLRDLPAHFGTDQGDYAPRNYDNTFHGPVRLRVALGSSYNVPAVRLARFVGVDRVLARLRDLGFDSLRRTGRHYGLGLTLGNGEVTLQELVGAYAALAREGSWRPLRLLARARAPGGAPLALPRSGSRRAFSRRVSYLVSQILADPAARAPAFGRHTPLDLEFSAAVKTGTSKDFRDNWTVGYTPQVTVGVWVGNFDGSSMHNVSGISGAGPLWAQVMELAMEGRERRRFHQPPGIVTRRVCPLSGALAGDHCPAGVDELFEVGSQPRADCGFHQLLRLDRRNGLLAGPGCPEDQVSLQQRVVYPPAYRAWALARGLPLAPGEDSPLCPLLVRAAAVRITAPADGDQLFIDPDLRRRFQSLPLEATVQGPAREVRWLVDGSMVHRARFPFSARWPIRPGRHTIVALLPNGNRSQPVTVTVR